MRINYKCEEDECDKHDIELIIACENTPKAFDPAEKTLDLIAGFV